MTPSKYQKPIYRHVGRRKGSLIIEAAAGSGKTTILVEISKRIPKTASSIFLAFNKHIQQELQNRLPENCISKTLNGLGHGAVWGWCKRQDISIKLNAHKIDDIISKFLDDPKIKKSKNINLYWKNRGVIRRMVEYAKMMGIVPEEYLKKNKDQKIVTYDEDTYRTWMDMMETYDLCDKIQELSKSDVTLFQYMQEAVIDFSRQVLIESLNDINTIDFSDQIYLPVVFNLKMRKYDWVMADEIQDFSPLQLELIKKITNSNTTVIGAGDRLQALYHWRGAMDDAMDRFKKKFKCTELPLSICYRCPPNVIELAKEFNPNIEAWEELSVGMIEDHGTNYKIEDMDQNGMVISRNTAPLLQIALNLLKHKHPFRFTGRDFSKELNKLIDTLVQDNSTRLITFQENLQEWKRKKMARLTILDRPELMAIVRDQYMCLTKLCSQCDAFGSVYDLKQTIQKIFNRNDTVGIQLSTIHKAKGMEADTVFFVDRDMLPSDLATTESDLRAERNILYVGLTRVKNKLVFIKTPLVFREEYYKKCAGK